MSKCLICKEKVNTEEGYFNHPKGPVCDGCGYEEFKKIPFGHEDATDNNETEQRRAS